MKWKFCAKSAWSGRGHGLPLKSNGWEDPFPSSNLAVILTCWTNVYPSVGEIPMFGWLYPAMIGSLWISVPYCWLYSQTSSITSCFIQAKGELNPLLANHSVPILVKSCEMTKSFMDGKVRSNRFWKLSIVIPCFFHKSHAAGLYFWQSNTAIADAFLGDRLLDSRDPHPTLPGWPGDLSGLQLSSRRWEDFTWMGWKWWVRMVSNTVFVSQVSQLLDFFEVKYV